LTRASVVTTAAVSAGDALAHPHGARFDPGGRLDLATFGTGALARPLAGVVAHAQQPFAR
jgi:hypothetical protein